MNTQQLLTDIVLHPRRYDLVANVPGRYEAAVQLANGDYKITARLQSLIKNIINN